MLYVERGGLEEVGLAAGRVLPGDRSRHALRAWSTGQRREMRAAQGRRPDPERARADRHGRHHGPTSGPSCRSCSDILRRRAQADRRARSRTSPTTSTTLIETQLGGARAAAQPRRPHRRATSRASPTAEADDVKVVDQEHPRDHRVGEDAWSARREGEVKATGAARAHARSTSCRRPIDNLDKSDEERRDRHHRLEKGEGTAGRLLTDDTIARNVEEITEDAGSFVRGITRLQTIVGLRTEYNFLSSTFKNYLLDPADAPARQVLPDRARRGSARLPRADRRTVTQQLDDGRQLGDHGRRSREQLRFSLQFGKRDRAASPAASASRSRRAASASTSTCSNDRLTLSVDVFDARTNQYPRIKAAIAAAIWKRNLFVVAGVDDLANLHARRAPARRRLRLVLRRAADLQRRGSEVAAAVRRRRGRGRRPASRHRRSLLQSPARPAASLTPLGRPPYSYTPLGPPASG